MTTPSKFIDALKKYVGVPYQWGGKHPSQGGLDCSGLITLALDDVGVKFPQGSANQINATRQITVDQGWNTPGALLYRPGHDAISLGNGTAIEAITPKVTITDRTATLNGKPRFTRAGIIPGVHKTGGSMAINGNAVAESAKSRIGHSGWSGLCEAFTRTAFGFSAKYASANLAYRASKRAGKMHMDTSPPPGVPVFWDITRGVNAPYDHVAVSIGGGEVVSTSVGKNKTPAIIGINELTKLWGMRYRGWAEVYHGVRVYRTSTKPTTPPAKKEYFDMDKKTFENGLDSAFQRNAEYLIDKFFASRIKISGALAKRLGVKTMNVSTVLRHSAANLTESREKFAQTWKRLNNQNEVLRRIANQTVKNEKELKEINDLLDERLPEVEEVSLNDLAKDE